MRYTDQQEEIFAAGTGEHMKIIAGAGAGKTTTIIELQRRTRQRALYCPFNRTIAEEAVPKFSGTNCQVSTLHAFAWRTISERGQRPYSGGASDVRQSGALNAVIWPRFRGIDQYTHAVMVQKTVSKFCTSDETKITPEMARDAIMDLFGDPDSFNSAALSDRVKSILDKFVQPVTQVSKIYMKHLVEEQKYTHDVYLKMFELSPALIRQAFAGFKAVYKDEAQDSNQVEMSIMRKSGLPIISVGDPYQQIYSWRGAVNALDLLPGKKLHLSESFRFGPEIANASMEILDRIPGKKPDFRLIGAGNEKPKGSPNNAVICRTNAGVLDAAITLMENKGRRVKYFIDNAETLARDLMDAEDFRDGGKGKGVFAPYSSWTEVMAEGQAGDKAMDRIVNIVENDKTEEVMKILDHSENTEKTAELMIMTAHRSKGREFPFVKLGADWSNTDDMLDRWEKARTVSKNQETLALEEYNALYVAYTRASVKGYGLKKLIGEKPLPHNEPENAR